MDGELWREVYRMVSEIGDRFRTPKVQFSNGLIVLVFLWANWHDRPTTWACRAENWPAEDRPNVLPSDATMSRRLRRVPVLTLLQAIESKVRDLMPPSLIKTIDAKPLPVGGCSKDRDAKRGRAASGQAKGYKLFTICEGGQRLDAWRLGPMNQSETLTGRVLMPEAAHASLAEGYVLGDSLYDSNPLHAIVTAHGHQLVAPRKKPRAGLGHRRHAPGRLRCLELMANSFGQSLYRCRTGIERFFAHMGNFGGGLAPLPNWVRTPHRVARWVAGKIVLNGLRIAINRGILT